VGRGDWQVAFGGGQLALYLFSLRGMLGTQRLRKKTRTEPQIAQSGGEQSSFGNEMKDAFYACMAGQDRSNFGAKMRAKRGGGNNNLTR
jgi:hypothetical protein